jgi:hypothetical protein
MSAITRPGLAPSPVIPVSAPATVAGPVTQVRVVRAEWTKLRALRSTRWCTLVAAVLIVGLGAAIAGSGTAYHVSAVNRPISAHPVDNRLPGRGLLPGSAAGAFEAADGFLVAADLGRDGFEAAAQLVDLDGQAGQGAGVLAAGAVLVDDGAQVGAPVEGGAADPREYCDCAERDGLPGRGEFGAGGLGAGEVVAVSWHWPGR